MNLQTVEKQEISGPLYVNGIFYTIQGEGPLAGEPAVFVRLAGCNLQCPSCDTEYTYRESMTPKVIRDAVFRKWSLLTSGYPLVVLTGGEPFRQGIGDLVSFLLAEGCPVQIETNGTLFVEKDMPWNAYPFGDDRSPLTVVCSPKTGRINERLLPHINAFKYVLSHDAVDPEDGLPTLALSHSAHPRVYRPPRDWATYMNDAPEPRPIFVQPLDAKDAVENARNLEAAVKSCLRFNYRLSIQLHKLANLE